MTISACRDQIRRMYRSGTAVADIAKHFGCTRQNIYAILALDKSARRSYRRAYLGHLELADDGDEFIPWWARDPLLERARVKEWIGRRNCRRYLTPVESEALAHCMERCRSLVSA